MRVPQIFCKSEYDELKKVVVCEPRNMTVPRSIHLDHTHTEPINLRLALQQHECFIETLKKQGIDVVQLPTLIQYPDQVFTRDTGFMIGTSLFVTEMSEKLRKGEEVQLRTWLATESIPYTYLAELQMDGGDVILAGDTIFVGISTRTNEKALVALEKLVPEHTVIPLYFHKRFLHLDCVFNIVSPEVALIYSDAFEAEDEYRLASQFDVIRISEEEQLRLATNVLSIGNQTVISLPENEKVNKQLQRHGLNVIEIEFSEMIKAGGSFRCCTLPIYRAEKTIQ